MPKTRSTIALGILPLSSIIACLTICGCDRSDQITSYTVPKHELLQTKEFLADEEHRHPKPIPKRLIGVVIPKGSLLWFLKLDGNVDAVAARENDVREFLKSLRFTQSESTNVETLEWNLPNGWQQLPANEMRYATLVLDGRPPLEMSVTKLAIQPDMDLSEQVLANINRWRNQLSLLPIEKEDLDSQAEKLTLNDVVAYWVNLEGTSIPKPAGKAPKQQPHPAVAPQNKPPESFVPTYVKPAEWQEAAPTMFAKVSLQALDGDKKVAITVTPARGNRDMNVNRWRSQVKLDELTTDQLAATAKKVDVGNETGDLYEMTNDGQTILGVIVEDQDQFWFVKLVGDHQLAERERPRFEAFLKSLKLK